MTRISNLFVASTLAFLPISAFAQQTATPVKTAAPTNMTSPAPVTAPAAGKAATGKSVTAPTADVTKPANPALKTPAVGTKTQVHGMNTVKTHHIKTSVPAQTAEPAKS
jgi:hypothetical protein